jgi:hypothetical protein
LDEKVDKSTQNDTLHAGDQHHDILNTIVANYSKSSFFREYKMVVEEAYMVAGNKKYLSEINYSFIILVCEILNIKTKI